MISPETLVINEKSPFLFLNEYFLKDFFITRAFNMWEKDIIEKENITFQT